jgi:hypothetical protein
VAKFPLWQPPSCEECPPAKFPVKQPSADVSPLPLAHAPDAFSLKVSNIGFSYTKTIGMPPVFNLKAKALFIYLLLIDDN